MQKYIELLEKHVQWLVIGVSVLFFGWMVYTYWLEPPATLALDGETLTPGEVDPHILTHQARKLEEVINTSRPIEMQVTPFTEQFVATMGWGNQQIATLSPDKFVPLPPRIPSLETVQSGDPAPGAVPIPGRPQPPQVAMAKIKALPILPAAQPLETRVGRSTVLPDIPAGQAAPAPQPGVPVVGGEDKAWVTQKFTIPMRDIDAAFVAAKIPPQFAPTYFIQVELIREEMDADGNWDAKTQTVVPPLKNIQIQPLPAPGNKVADGEFLNWAINNTSIIIAPPFYAVAAGDPWVPPGVEAAAAIAQPFDAATTTKRLDQMTDEEKAAYIKYKQEDAKRKAEEKRQKQKSQPKPAPGRGGGPPEAGGPTYAPREDARPASPPARPPAPPRRPPVNLDIPPEMRGTTDGVGNIGDGNVGPGAPIAMPQPGVAFPNGQFVPAEWKDKDTEGWAHDDTVVAGRTYRYKLRYKLKNPIFQVINIADPPSLANEIAVSSPDGEWSDSVTVPNVVNFFVANNAMQGSTRVKFDVFRWDDGTQKKETFTVEPGDPIGAKKHGIDFSTGCTVVDVRSNSRTNLTEIIVMKPDGKTALRSYYKDQNDPMYQQLKTQAGNAPVPPPTGGISAAGP